MLKVREGLLEGTKAKGRFFKGDNCVEVHDPESQKGKQWTTN